MSNFKDQESEISRLLNAKKDKKTTDASSALGSSSLYKTQAEKLPFRNEYRSPQSKIGETPSLFSQPRNLTTQEQNPTSFTRPRAIDIPKEPKKHTFNTSPVKNPFDKPLRNPFDKPITPPAPTTPPPLPLNSKIVHSNLSFKEKMQALQEKQAETRALLAATLTKPSLAPRTPLGSATTPTSVFAEKKPASLFTERKPLPLFAEQRQVPLFTEQRQVPLFTPQRQVPLFTAHKTQSDNSNITRPTSILPSQFKTDYKISSEEFTLLRDFLYAQSGIFVAENRKYLMENRLSSRLRELGLHNFNEYHNYLRFDHNRMVELNKLFENMTTNETSFFRNNPQLDIFKDKVLARIVNEQRQKGQKKIHIWSAGCSSGEEPYTIAIILHEFLKTELSGWNIKITANDLSPAMLESAKKGLYSEYALRTTPPEIINKYFTKEGKLFKILPSVQKLVNFEQINLASSAQLARVERSHIVFCRNVIIYFDDDMKRHVINAFYDNLLPDGCLLIGHSESLHNISRTFIPEHFTGAIVYGKKN